MTAPYRGQMDPVYPCRVMPTRHCPASYRSVCGTRLCARFESDDETPWLPELEAAELEAQRLAAGGW